MAKCDIPDCGKEGVYTLFWKRKNPEIYIEKDVDSVKHSCAQENHIIRLILHHPWGVPVNEIMLTYDVFCTDDKLKERANRLACEVHEYLPPRLVKPKISV